MTADTPAGQRPRILTRPDGSSIAYRQSFGQGTGVVFLHGLMSDMQGTKALYLDEWCRTHNRSFLRFDQYGHGKSSGHFVDGSIGRWAEDTIAVLDSLCEGPQVLVGSSMGGWVMLLAALARPEKVKGLLGIAPAPDFSQDLMWDQLSAVQKDTLTRDGILHLTAEDTDFPYSLSKTFFEDGRQHCLLDKPIAFSGPVRILQGQNDSEVPWKRALTLTERLTGNDVICTLVKGGNHRLSTPHDLTRMVQTLDELLSCVEDEHGC